MKKTIFISLSVLFIFLIISVWVYLFIYGAPDGSREIFGNFNIGNGDAEFTREGDSSDGDEGGGDSETERRALRQLTTRPVAGAIFTDGAIRYAERGTGYVYEITPEGKETQVTNTTIPQTVRSKFSSDGTRVVMTAQRSEENESIVAAINSQTVPGTLEGVSLPSGVHNIAWDASGKGVSYLLETAVGSTGYLYDTVLDRSTSLFEIPLKDVVVLWGVDSTYVYTTPTALQTGYIYRLTGNALEYVTRGARGLTAIRYSEGMVLTRNENGTIISSGPTKKLAFPLFPEKCVHVPVEDSVLYCGAALEQTPGEYPDDWYKGERTFIDSLWKVYVESGDSVLLSDLLDESGREIDIAEIGTSPDGSYVYFINKNDGTLWLFDTTLI